MFQDMRNFSQLSNTAKLSIAAIGGGGIVALASVFSAKYLLLFLGGAVAVVVLIIGLTRLLAVVSKMKAAPMLQGLLQNTSSTPKGITDAGKMAKLDDLRKKFEEGLGTFKKAGKSLYDFPWFIIVGEPGSGKTEAIRHCNIGFPPGLQDEFQGAGGTLNMNWWFTDHAVILDTAGRLMFEEVTAGQTSEWKEFLSLLKKFRYNCPINGLFLAIPADSLIRDSADEIEKKASQIARQLDVIQRILDVRFPVFIIITKSDLITGFRDFFVSVDDPGLQHQIFGWSNPAPLDEPFNPSFIDQQIKTVKNRLTRRRLALLYKTTVEENTSLSTCLKESMYAFPSTLEKLAPRMSLYLERIFSIGNQWSCKPLFFRGIYFTSSMQEGSALDQELASTLGVPVESLPDGRVWAREKAYFLRDLFMKKVFVEKGLVSRASNASRQHTQRKAVVLVTLIISVLCMILFTLYGVRHYRRNIDKLNDFGSIRQDNISYMKLFDNNGVYIGNKNFMDTGLTKKARVYKLLQAANEWNEKCQHLWRPFQVVNSEQLSTSARNIYSYTLADPLIQNACSGLAADPNGWRSLQDKQIEKPSSNVYRLNTLLNIYGTGRLDKAKLSELAGYTLEAKEVSHLKGEVTGSDAKMNLFEVCPAGMEITGDFREKIRPEMDLGLEQFLKYWGDPNQFAQTAALNVLAVKLEEYDAIEKKLLQNEEFQFNFKLLTGKQEEISNYLLQNNIETLSGKCSDMLKQASKSADAVFGAITVAPADWVTLKKDLKSAGQYEAAREGILKKLEAGYAAKKVYFTRLDKIFLEANSKKSQNLLQDRFDIWNSVNQLIAKTLSPDTRFLDVMLNSAWPQEMVTYRESSQGKEYSHEARMKDLQGLFISRAFKLIESKAPRNVGDLETGIIDYLLVKNQESQKKTDVLPAGQDDSMYDIQVYGDFKQRWKNVCAIFGAQTVEPKWGDLQKAIEVQVGNYENRYLEYWKGICVIRMVQDLLDQEAKDALGLQVGDKMPEAVNWQQQSVILDKMMPESVLERITRIKEQSINAVKTYNGVNPQNPVSGTEDECTVGSKMEDMIRKWAALSKMDDQNARTRLKGLTSGEMKGYYNYKKDSFGDSVWGLYICGLANRTLEALNNTSHAAAREKLKQYQQVTDKYPFNMTSRADVTESELNMLNALFANVPGNAVAAPVPEQYSAGDTGMVQLYDKLLRDTLNHLHRTTEDNYAKLDKSWEYWCREEIDGIKTKYDKIPNQCEIWLTKNTPPKNPVYKYFRIQGFTGDEWMFVDADKMFGPYRFPWRDVQIVCKKTADMESDANPAAKVTEESGIWSFLRMCPTGEKSENIKPEYSIVFPIGDSNEKLNLRVKFYKAAQ